MKVVANSYARKLANAMTPELKRRLEIIAANQKTSVESVIVEFLTKGANTPLFLGVGASTSTNKHPSNEKQK